MTASLHFQTVVAEINHAIGAEGIVSMECKEVVAEYGERILELLLLEVCSLLSVFMRICQWRPGG